MIKSKKCEFQGDLGLYKIGPTEDGSNTFWSEAYFEHGHSLSGAKTETQFIYYEGCQIEKLLKSQNEVSILEVGFGTGLGASLTYDNFIKMKNSAKLSFYSVEIDEALIKWIIENKEHPLFQKLEKIDDGHYSYYKSSVNNFELIVFIGNARETIPHFKSLIRPLNAIYQDPFSPKKNPLLWSIEWFKELAQISTGGVILSTYSASSSIRKSLLEASWYVHNRSGFGSKRSSTLAYLKGDNDPDLMAHILRSPVPPISDLN